MAHFTITIPVEIKDRNGGDPRTAYRRVGALFENHKRDTGEVYYTIRLDFPVGATEMIAFQPKPEDDGEEAG